MHPPVHEVAQGLINQPMPRNGIEAGELPCNDDESVMPAAARRASMARMLRAFIENFHIFRLQRLQTLVYGFQGIRHGKVFLKGRTRTCAYTPAAT